MEKLIFLDYETLRVLWWLLLGALAIGFAIMDGFDLGVGTLLPFVARSDTERRMLINSIAPVWEGNQVWLVLGAGAAFAAWPPFYAVVFSGFYVAVFLVLVALILRPVGFTFRSKVANPAWRALWDWALFAGGLVPALGFGVAFGNLLLGVPFHFDDNLRPFYTGGFFGLFAPFAVLCGVLSVVMLV
ncbi:MAG: cytochrome d ubiquinol oxidase subunit II, partial [Kiloniellales bacterium]